MELLVKFKLHFYSESKCVGRVTGFLLPLGLLLLILLLLLLLVVLLLLLQYHPLTLSLQAYNLPFPQILPTAALHFFFLNIHYMDSPDCLLLFLSIYFFLLLVFFLFLHFLVVVSVR